MNKTKYVKEQEKELDVIVESYRKELDKKLRMIDTFYPRIK